MSYLVEVSKEDHKKVVQDTVTEWSRRDDLQLVSVEGHRVSSSRVLLSLYSDHLRSILNHPAVSFSPDVTAISVPASASTISSLLTILATGRTGCDSKETLGDTKSLAQALGISLKNFFVENRKSPNGGLRLIKLPLQPETIQNIPMTKSKPKIIKTISTVKSLPRSDISKVASKPSESTSSPTLKWNTSIINKSSKLRIELKEVGTDEKLIDGPKEEPVSETGDNPNRTWACDVCPKQFKEQKFMLRHRYRAHGLRKRELKPEGEMKIKIENVSTKFPNQCKVCMKVYHSEEMLMKHVQKKHGKKRIFQCDDCKKTVGSKGELQAHVRIHLPESERPFKCDVCEKRFCQKGQKKIHMTKYHESDLDSTKKAEKETNETVTEENGKDETLNEETATAVTGNLEEDPFADSKIFLENNDGLDVEGSEDNCGYCGKKFDCENELNLHIIEIHG